MRTIIVIILIPILFILTGCTGTGVNQEDLPAPAQASFSQTISLPDPIPESAFSLEESLKARRSVREYSQIPLRLEEVSQLLWSAQGITADFGGRTAPSAGALYPLEVYLAAGNVEKLSPGVYIYKPRGHEIELLKNQDVREELSGAAVGQLSVRNGAVSIVISAVYERTTIKYGDRGVRYVHIETGHAAQNVCLQATSLNLGAVTIGAFNDKQVKDILGMPENEDPLYIIPVGKSEITKLQETITRKISNLKIQNSKVGVKYLTSSYAPINILPIPGII